MKIFMIVCACLIVAGLILIGVDVFVHGLQSSEPIKTENLTYSADLTHIRLDVTDADVKIIRTAGDRIEIETRTQESRPFTFTEQNGELTVTRTVDRKWYRHIGIFIWDTESYTIRIALPDRYAGDLTLETSSGNITLTGLTLNGMLTLRTSSGDTSFSELDVNKDIDIRSGSGDCYGNDMKASAVEISTSSGDIRLESASAAGSFRAHSTSGDIRVCHIAADGQLELEATSGDIFVRQMTAAGNVSMKQTSGNLKLENAKAPFVSLSSTSGDCRINELETDSLKVEKRSGDTIANNVVAGTLEIHSSSGDTGFSETTVLESLTARSRSGDVRFSLTDPESDFTVVTETTSGRRPSNGGTGEKHIRITTTSGNISLQFAES